MTDHVEAPITQSPPLEAGETRVESNEALRGRKWTMSCGCGYARSWGSWRAAEDDQLVHECDPGQYRTVAAVWLVTATEVAVRWIRTAESTSAEGCAYCRYLGVTDGPCAGLEHHAADYHDRQVELTPRADVRSGLFELPATLNRYDLVRTVTFHAEAASAV